MVSVVDDAVLPVVFLEGGGGADVCAPDRRAEGVRLVTADPKDGVRLHAHHRCHDGWEHSADLTSFVVGVQ